MPSLVLSIDTFGIVTPHQIVLGMKQLELVLNSIRTEEQSTKTP